jgi:hypothetical protein
MLSIFRSEPGHKIVVQDALFSVKQVYSLALIKHGHCQLAEYLFRQLTY